MSGSGTQAAPKVEHGPTKDRKGSKEEEESAPEEAEESGKSKSSTEKSTSLETYSPSHSYSSGSSGRKKKSSRRGSSNESKPYMTVGKDDGGKGIFFKIPGKVTHKTTIRIASFPDPCCGKPCCDPCCESVCCEPCKPCCEPCDPCCEEDDGKELEIEEVIPIDMAPYCPCPGTNPCQSPCPPKSCYPQCPPCQPPPPPPCCQPCQPCYQEMTPPYCHMNNCNINYGTPPCPSGQNRSQSYPCYTQTAPNPPRYNPMSIFSSLCGPSQQPQSCTYNYYQPQQRYCWTSTQEPLQSYPSYSQTQSYGQGGSCYSSQSSRVRGTSSYFRY